MPRFFQSLVPRANSIVLSFLLATILPAFSSARPPNIVFILADDLGWSDLGCYGGDLIRTPNIDGLAKEGIRFTDFYTASPVCSPTRASILTGQHPARLHMTTWFEATQQPPGNQKLLPAKAIGNLPVEEITISKTLHDAGFLTALVGKWHLGDASHYPEAFGFDINIGGTQWGAPETYFFPYRGSNTWGDGFRYIPHLEFGRPGEYLTDRLTDESLQVIDRAGNRPFFLYLAHHAPHTPIEAKPEVTEEFEKTIKANPDLHHRYAKYAAMIQSVDDSVGRILKKLRTSGIEENTMVIFTSDNGGYVNDWRKQAVTDNFPLRSGKGSLYEGGIRVPLIVRWPGVTHAGAVCAEPTISTDFFSTLAEATGSRATSQDGQSLIPLLNNEKTHLQRDALYFHFPHYYQTSKPVSAIRAGDWKLLEYYEDGRTELYNLKEDLSEKQNLAAKMPAKAEELKRRLRQWLEESSAQLPTPNNNYKKTKESGRH